MADMIDADSVNLQKHKECSPSQVSKNENAVKKVMEVFQNLMNLFEVDDESKLYPIACGAAASDEVIQEVLSAKKEFITERLEKNERLFEPIKRQKHHKTSQQFYQEKVPCTSCTLRFHKMNLSLKPVVCGPVGLWSLDNWNLFANLSPICHHLQMDPLPKRNSTLLAIRHHPTATIPLDSRRSSTPSSICSRRSCTQFVHDQSPSHCPLDLLLKRSSTPLPICHHPSLPDRPYRISAKLTLIEFAPKYQILRQQEFIEMNLSLKPVVCGPVGLWSLDNWNLFANLSPICHHLQMDPLPKRNSTLLAIRHHPTATIPLDSRRSSTPSSICSRRSCTQFVHDQSPSHCPLDLLLKRSSTPLPICHHPSLPDRPYRISKNVDVTDVNRPSETILSRSRLCSRRSCTQFVHDQSPSHCPLDLLLKRSSTPLPICHHPSLPDRPYRISKNVDVTDVNRPSETILSRSRLYGVVAQDCNPDIPCATLVDNSSTGSMANTIRVSGKSQSDSDCKRSNLDEKKLTKPGFTLVVTSPSRDMRAATCSGRNFLQSVAGYMQPRKYNERSAEGWSQETSLVAGLTWA
ncbi:hypothetical protein GQR58_028602 [Nymphon striatum]|nr:hypothetical protein GQR58_028602 [Nymphon striatum]